MKVLIVDDEDIICEWLQFCISQNPVCQLAGVAHNGREALEVFRASQPDLVLTDIKMPVMDGLELLHAIRATGSAAKVVVLTAFAEFDMARQALREGADEYLLKTEMQNDALQQLLGRMSRQYNLQGGAGLVGSAQAHAIIRKVLRRQGELSEEDLAELRRCGVRWRDNGLFALAVWKQDLMGAGLTFPQEGPAHHVAGFDYTDRIYVVVGNLPRALSENEKARQLTQYAQQTQRMNDCMVGISATTDQMRQIPSLARQAAFSLAQGFYTGKKRLYEPQKPLPALQEQVRGWKAQVSALRLGLYQQRPAQRCESLQAFLDETARDRMPAVELVTKFCTELFEQFYLEAKEAGIALPPQEEARERLAQSISMPETTALVMDFARQCALAVQPEKPRSKAVNLAVEYIRRHFAETISLEQVAAEVYLNPEYFSRVFKEEMGVTFVNFLTELRLKHSVRLLESTALRVQDVAQQVGYPNVSYFSTTFKKRYGMSPYEYRRQN